MALALGHPVGHPMTEIITGLLIWTWLFLVGVFGVYWLNKKRKPEASSSDHRTDLNEGDDDRWPWYFE